MRLASAAAPQLDELSSSVLRLVLARRGGRPDLSAMCPIGRDGNPGPLLSLNDQLATTAYTVKSDKFRPFCHQLHMRKSFRQSKKSLF
jgi:hypothetical protein